MRFIFTEKVNALIFRQILEYVGQINSFFFGRGSVAYAAAGAARFIGSSAIVPIIPQRRTGTARVGAGSLRRGNLGFFVISEKLRAIFLIFV